MMDEYTKPKCVHCGGFLLKEDGERKCLQCGRSWKTLIERHQFYDEHRFEILKDISEMGRPATIKKWQIPGSTLSVLLKDWLHEKAAVPAPADPPSTNHNLPELPAFSEGWVDQVKVKWLEVYETLLSRSK